jgi:squalene synthase HpnC
MSARIASPVPSTLSPDAIFARARGENFPVALPGISRSLRKDLLALYAFARLVDQVGDDAEGDRMAQLEALSTDLHRIPEAEPENPILQSLASVIHRHELPLPPFERLIEANRRDQSVAAMSTWEELVDSCTRSANPVGELVLGVLGQADEESIRLSDAICTGLQVVEHCQDVVEDLARNRIYLPAKDMERFGCTREDLAAPNLTPALKATVRLQVGRGRELLNTADRLLPRLRGIAVPLVGAYAAGGLATCDALERHGFDVVGMAIKPARRDFLWRWAGLVFRAIRARGRG